MIFCVSYTTIIDDQYLHIDSVLDILTTARRRPPGPCIFPISSNIAS